MRFKPSIVADSRFLRIAGAGVAALAIAACTSTSLDTVATGIEPPPALGEEALTVLGNSDVLPAPAVRPGASVGLTQAGDVVENGSVPASAPAAFAGPTPTAPTAIPIAGGSTDVVVAAATPAAPIEPSADIAPTSPTESATTTGTVATTVATDDVASQRIRAAQNAPTAASPAASPAETETAEVTNAEPPAPVSASASIVDNGSAGNSRPGFLSALFSNRRDDDGQRRPIVATSTAAGSAAPVIAEPAATPRPVIATASARGSTAGLPGFDRDRAFGIRAGGSDDGDQLGEAPVQLASAAGLARLAPNGLRTQHSRVDVACLKPALVRLLKRVEQRYRKPVIVTSGYRSPARNRAARGAKNSLHMYCAAADIQVPGVSKWDLAAYLRSMPGRGGVGTYCHTKSVHVDIGPKRDWNWRCRRRS